MERLEKKSEYADSLLNKIHLQLQDHTSADAQRWLKEVDKLKTQSHDTRVTIGIIGATGAGKSALMNALLDEERILPTSCMRACTAVVTEISYNRSAIPYRAEIEFIGKEQWQAELSDLLNDLLDDNGKLTRDCNNEDTAAGLAYSKIKAIYPNMSRDDIATASVGTFMSHRSSTHLDTTVKIEEHDPTVFYKKLQSYVDSKEKVDLRQKASKASTEILEYWPLIKVVRIYVKSHVLADGAVLVDLPGVHDSNATRAAVSKNYLKLCTGLLIVAPITRAVDDKSAKNLLGDTFKNQLKLDGNISNITFVCSKTDEIAISEAINSLGLSDEIDQLQLELENLDAAQTTNEAEREELQGSFPEVNLAHYRIDNELDQYQRLLKDSENGCTIFAPKPSINTQKRTRATTRTSARKKCKITDYIDSESDEEQNDEPDQIIEQAQCTQDDVQKPLTKQDVECKIAELREAKHLALQKSSDMVEAMKSKEHESKEIKRTIKAIRNNINKLCIVARNDYSRDAIKQDFAHGIQEIDQEIAAEDDPEQFNPSQMYRNYDEVAQALPVFCVSSRGYQQLCGRYRKEKKARGFDKIDDTEVPQLQDHCRLMAADMREASLGEHLDKVNVLCNSLKLWTSGIDQTQSLTEDELTRMKAALEADLNTFSTALLDTTQTIPTNLRNDIQKHIYYVFAKAVRRGSKEAITTAARWSKPWDRTDRAAGGIHPSTYKAIIRRNGYFAKKEIVYDFNRELADPFIKEITPGWERVFVQDTPDRIKATFAKVKEVVLKFQVSVAQTTTEFGISIASIRLLENQLQSHLDVLRRELQNVRKMINHQQKEINRKFVNEILDDMTATYIQCATECGNGMFIRMKLVMENGIEKSKESMFKAATDSIQEQLEMLIRDVVRELQAKTQDTISWIKQDYMQLSAGRAKQLLEDEQKLKDIITSLTNEYESQQLLMDFNSSLYAINETSTIAHRNRTPCADYNRIKVEVEVKNENDGTNVECLMPPDRQSVIQPNVNLQSTSDAPHDI